MTSTAPVPDDYAKVLAELKERVRSARLAAVRTVNTQLLDLYWQIGRTILERQEQHGWGAKVIDRLSKDLRAEFPDMTGFSPRNLRYMRTFAVSWPGVERRPGWPRGGDLASLRSRMVHRHCLVATG